jgi:hypothetical protein
VKAEGGKKQTVSKTAKIKIPAKDIRRNYPHIFARAFNSCDKEILNYCLTKYCVPDCICNYKYIGPPRQWSGSDNLQIIGIDSILRFWEVFFLAFPDSLFQVEESKLRVLSNGSSCANISKFVYFGTKVFKLSIDNDKNTVLFKQNISSPSPTPGQTLISPPPPILPQTSSLENDTKFVSQGIPKEGFVPTSGGNAHQAKDFGLEKSLEKHETTILIGSFSLFINADKKIYKIEFIYSMKQENK